MFAALAASLLATAAGAQAVRPAAASGRTVPPEYAVRFLDRTIDLRPYFQGFPYLGWDFDFDAQRLFYFHETPNGRFLMVQPLRVGRGSGLVEPAAGQRLHEVDWSKRNYGGMRYDSVTKSMVLQGDERNDEVFNLYRVSLQDGSLTRLTDVPYIYGWDWSKDNRQIGYVARFGTGEPYRTCLRVMPNGAPNGAPGAGGGDRELVCETNGEFRLTWGQVNFRPDGKGAVVRVNRNGNRKQANLAYVDLTAAEPKLEILLPVGPERFGFGAYRDWLDNDRFYYTSDESGYANLYVFDLKSRTSRQVTRVTEEAGFTPIEIGGRKLVQIDYTRPHETELEVIDPASGASLGRRTFDVNLGVAGFDDKNHFVVTKTSARSPFQADEMWVTLGANGRAEWTLEPKLRLPAAYASAVEQCNVERVQYPTFDSDAKTGKPRVLHAFLMTPKRPRANPAERLAVITAFYGGANSFSTQQQIYCEAGISWLSPAVRGSAGFGKEFAALNDRDLGGDEIVDLFYGARFLEKKLGITSKQIGVSGGSHGGYATMRALTYPPATNNRNERYPFGFGISHAGFSSIVSFYKATNIPDWIILESGDPATEREKLLDRSPLSHVARLESPLLLTHGANDNRVGVTESRQFAKAAEALGKPVTYVEFEGQGHSIKGLANQVRNYQTQFQFLESVLEGQGAAKRPAQVP